MAERDAERTGGGEEITPESMARLYDEAGRRITSGLKHLFAWPLAGSEPEDVVQETAARLLKSTQKFDPDRGKLEDFFFGMCIRVSQELARKAARGTKLEAAESDSMALEGVLTRDPVADGEGPSSQEVLAALAEEIEELPPQYRRIIEADLKAGGTARAEPLAREFRCHTSTIRSRRDRALGRLQKRLRRRGFNGAGD